MWLLDTNILIKCNKLRPRPFKKDLTFTTILSIIEYPFASKFEEMSIIYPTLLHYGQALKYALLLRKNGTPIPVIDILIGVITVEKNMILVSEDSHFDDLQAVEPRLKLIGLEIYIESLQKFDKI